MSITNAAESNGNWCALKRTRGVRRRESWQAKVKFRGFGWQSGQFFVIPVDLASIARVKVDLAKPQIAACSLNWIPESLLTNDAIFGKPVAAIV